MRILDIGENEDGSASVDVDLTAEEARLLIEVGFNTLLKELIDRDSARKKEE